MENYSSYNSRNIFEYFSRSRALLLCIDALDFTDGKGAAAPRMKVRCCNYDDSLKEGSRITDEVDVYIPISRFLVLTHDILTGVAARKKRLPEGADKYATFFEHYGGAKGASVTSTKLALVNGCNDNASFAFLATSGPGKLTSKGGIIPAGKDGADMGGAPQKSIFINIPDDKLKEFCLIGKAYTEQFIALDLQDRLSAVRKQRKSYQAQREQAYIESHGYSCGGD